MAVYSPIVNHCPFESVSHQWRLVKPTTRSSVSTHTLLWSCNKEATPKTSRFACKHLSLASLWCTTFTYVCSISHLSITNVRTILQCYTYFFSSLCTCPTCFENANCAGRCTDVISFPFEEHYTTLPTITYHRYSNIRHPKGDTVITE